MVFSDELGYDPDEWEECPPPDHFLVFSPLTRLVLSISAIGFAALFFWLIDQNKNKGGKREEEETEEKIHRIAISESSPASSDLFSTITGLFTSNGRETDFVQRSFRDEEKSVASTAAAAVREHAAKIDVRPDELSSSFHYKKSDEPKTAEDVRAELDAAAFELRDLLGDLGDKQGPPVPPHRSLLPDMSSVTQPLSDMAQRAQDGVAASAQRTKEYLGDIQAPTLSAVSDSLRDAYEQIAQHAVTPHDRAAEQVTDAYDSAAQAAHDAYDRVGQAAEPVTDTFNRIGQTAQGALGSAGAVAQDTYHRVAAPVTEIARDAYDHFDEPLATARETATQLAEGTKEGASSAYDRAAQAAHDAYDGTAAPASDAFDRPGHVNQEALGRAGEAPHAAYDRSDQLAQDSYDRFTAPIADAYTQVGHATQDAYNRTVDSLADASNRAALVTQDVYARAAEPEGQQQATVGAQRAADVAAEAYGRIIDPETARLEDDFERVQRDLDNLMAEHQVPLGVIIPGTSTSTTPAVSSYQQPSSPIDEHVRDLTACLLTSDGEQERKHSDIPSLHDIYEERQRQMSPPIASPVKIPTVEDRAALAQWEEELARKEQEKLEKLVDTIVGGDDISDIAASDGTEHLLPGERISMYSQESGDGQQQLQPLMQPLRRSDETECLPASAKINEKIDQISSALEQSLLSEIEQLARQTSTMQAELARARDSEYSADEVSEGVHAAHADPRLDAFQPAGDVRFIPASERPDQAAPISHSRDSERQSGESDDFVKITPPSHSGAPSPSPRVGLTSAEEEQLKLLVDEYDVIGSTSTLKKDASAPGALGAVAAAQSAAQLPSPTTATMLHEYETVQPQQQLLQPHQQQHAHFDMSKSASSPLAAYADSPLRRVDTEEEMRQMRQQYAEAAASRISAEEQAQLDEVLRSFEMTPGVARRNIHTPRTPPHTPENALMDPFGRPIQGLPDMPESATFTMSGEVMSPTTEMTFPLAPRRSIGDLKKTFPSLPSEVVIEVVDPAVAQLPKDAIIPSDLEDVLASLVNVDSTELFLPSQQPPDEAVAAAAHAAAQQHETPILSGPTPEPSKKESAADSPFAERKPTVVAATATAPLAAALQQQASLDLSQPLQPPMAAFDRPTPDGVKPTAAAVHADFVVRQQGGIEDEPHAAYSAKPQMMPAFDVRIKKPVATASATIPHEELQKADAIFQDALDYMHAQKQPSKAQQPQQATGFIIEEEMLSSHGENAPRRPEKSAEGTSKLVKTNDIFERLDAHDDHDDMTYAPEIQSVEIPPDQLSETSELPHEDLPIDDVPVLFKSPEAQKLEAEIRAQESAMDEAKYAMQHRAALAQAPHIISMNSKHPRFPSTPSISSAKDSPKALRKQSSLLSILGVTSTQEMLLKIDSLEALSNAMRKAGLESTNVIFGIDYTASNKYQGEESFGGHSLHTIHPNLKNPYQQVITILGRTLAPFTTTGNIPVYGFGDAKTSDWSVFSLKDNGHCTTLEEVLKTYNEITPTIELSGPTNFSPLIYQAIEICQRTREYHILVIIADGQVTNEKATRRAIVQACQYPLSIIVVGVGDGPWDMMRVFDESLPKRPWDNFHFVEFHEVLKKASGAADGDVKVAIQSLLEIPDQYRCICNLGLLKGRSPSIAHKNT